ncbi:hypothetical protein ACQY0O_005242 [Thecaphora frezii]
MNRSMQPTGWIRASDSPAPPSRQTPAKRSTSASRLALKENAPSALGHPDAYRPSPEKRLVLQERNANLYLPASTPTKRTLPSWSDSAGQFKKLKPSSAAATANAATAAANSGSRTLAQTTLSAFLKRQPRVDARAVPSADDEDVPTTSTPTSARRAVVQAAGFDDDDDVFQRAQKMLKSGRFGSVPRSVNPSLSDPDARRLLSDCYETPTRARAPLNVPASSDRVLPRNQKRPAPRDPPPAAPSPRITEPSPPAPPPQAMHDTQETPFMHESLSNFQPFAWQEKSKRLMVQLKRRIGMRETQIQQEERAAMTEELARAHRRMQGEGPAHNDEANEDDDDDDETAEEVADFDETQPLGSDGGEYEDEEVDAAEHVAQGAAPTVAPQPSNPSSGKAIQTGQQAPSSTQAEGVSCIVLSDDDGLEDQAVAQLAPLSQQRRPLGWAQVVTRSPTTKRRVYALETQFKHRPALVGGRSGDAAEAAEPLLAQAPEAHPSSSSSSSSSSRSTTAAHSPQKARPLSGSSQSRSQTRPSVRRSLRPQSDLLAAFQGSSSLTSVTTDDPRHRTSSSSSVAPLQREATAESGCDGGASESAVASLAVGFSSCTDGTSDPRRGPEDETYRDPDEEALRRCLLQTPVRRLPMRKAASAKKAAAGVGRGPRSSLRAEVPAEEAESQATQPLAWDEDEVVPACEPRADEGEVTKATLAPPRADGDNDEEEDDEETQPLAWESDSDGTGNTSERAYLERARKLNERTVRRRASEVRSAMSLSLSPNHPRGGGAATAAAVGQGQATSDEDANPHAAIASQGTLGLERTKGFRNRYRRSNPTSACLEQKDAKTPTKQTGMVTPRASKMATPRAVAATVNPVSLQSPQQPETGKQRFEAILDALHLA